MAKDARASRTCILINARAMAITGSTTAAQSALDKLKAPNLSDLSRKRKVAVNPPRGKRRCKSTNTLAAAASVPPQQRVKEFVGEHLSVSSGKLFWVLFPIRDRA